MLHDIAVGTVAEQPAGKISPPLAVRARPHVQLDEGAGFLDIFPRCGGFACLKPNDRIADTQRFTRLQGQVAGQAIAFVQQADDRGALGHGRARQGIVGSNADRCAIDLDGSGLVCGGHIILAAACQQGAGDQRDGKQDRRNESRRASDHDASGLHAS